MPRTTKITQVKDGPDVALVYDRVVEIIRLITPTQSTRAEVEYSALIGVATMIMTSHAGIEPTPENMSRIQRAVVTKIVPEIESELERYAAPAAAKTRGEG